MLRLNEQTLEEIILKEKNDTLSKNEIQIFKYKIDILERSIKSFYTKSILNISFEIIILILVAIFLIISWIKNIIGSSVLVTDGVKEFSNNPYRKQLEGELETPTI